MKFRCNPALLLAFGLVMLKAATILPYLVKLYRDMVKLDGSFGRNGITSAIISDLLSGIGKAGNIQVNTGSLFVLNGAQLSSSTNGQGDAGNITINARDIVSFEGFGGKSDLPSIATNTVVDNGIGNAGNIRVNARALFLKNGGQLNASSFANGGGGNIFIDTSDTISIDSSDKQSGILTFISGNTGKGGNIQLTTGLLSLMNGVTLKEYSVSNFVPRKQKQATSLG
ncbi:MAG: hypothetical protein KME64_38950 [Scytonematopsis contorta HA4267-MV1]|jgi:large exoprotein involved in heme utilization and adhesion|nr:hypothetical protein [Scytonematopsis contorta HA4267-MV1]